MDWKDVAGVVKKAAPLLGAALAPVTGGASVMAGGAVNMLLSAFGVGGDASPEELMATMQADPEMVVKLRQIEADNRVALAKIALDRDRLAIDEKRLGVEQEMAALAEVNKTMRAEAKSEHWIQYSWRPLWGIISAGAFAVVCLGVCILAWRAIKTGDAQFIGTIPMLVGAFTTLFSIPGAILGISAWGRNKLKEKTAGQQRGRAPVAHLDNESRRHRRAAVGGGNDG